MKVCGICNRTYPDSANVCDHDGQRLQSVRREEATAAAPILDWEGPLVGDVFGNYRIEALLAEGGMGRLYKAVHVGLGRVAALKFLLPEHVARPDLVQRFFNEARAVNAIHHPHMIEIYDFVETVDQEGHAQVYLVMEYLDGQDARRRMVEQGPFDTRALISLAVQTAETLAAAHEAGILHRDLKPDNIFLCKRDGRDEFVKLLDFGAAKGFGHREGNHLTRPGVAIGTPEYMSPEQITNRPLDGRVDAYGLGCVCYELLTGTLPFQGDVAAILAKHTSEPPPPISARRRVDPAVPPELAEVVLRCMAKRPEDRYPDLWATAEAFRHAADAAGVEAPPATREAPAAAAPGEATAAALHPSLEVEDSTGASFHHTEPHGLAGVTADEEEAPEDLLATNKMPAAEADDDLFDTYKLEAASAPSAEAALRGDTTPPRTDLVKQHAEEQWEPRPVSRVRHRLAPVAAVGIGLAVVGAVVVLVLLLIR